MADVGLAVIFANGVTDTMDMAEELKDLVNTVAPANARWGQTKAKDFLCNSAARKMTKAMLDLRDPAGEVRGWLMDIKEMHRIAVQ